jgi:hypothetical protein
MMVAPSFTFAAIARDTSNSGQTPGTGSSNTVSLTLAGGDTLLIATFANRSGGDNLTNITWNGTNMTFEGKLEANTSNQAYIYYYYMFNPTSGTHNLVANFSATSDNTYLYGDAYSGTSASAFPDNSTTCGPTTSSPLTCTFTPVAAGAWTIFFGYNNSGFTGHSDTQVQAVGATILTDSNGTVTGSKSMTGSFSSDTAGGIMFSIAPPGAAATNPFQLWPFSFF